jgi:hypothetical protein
MKQDIYVLISKETEGIWNNNVTSSQLLDREFLVDLDILGSNGLWTFR